MMDCKGFKITLHTKEYNEITAEHSSKLLVILDEFCETYGYEIDTFKTITRYFPD